uniref:Chromosome 1 open reading frame 230 n=1 Tax=Latimeria chalumnae TaxID=7897 RepID=H3BAN8_LATCH
MNQGVWKLYKSKVLKTLGSSPEEELKEETNDFDIPEETIPAEERSSTVSQIAQKVQTAGAKGWKTVASLFNKEDDHKLLTNESSVSSNDHPLAVKMEEETNSAKRTSGFWDAFATKWQQTSRLNQNAAPSKLNECNEEPHCPDAATNVTEDEEATGFKWGFLLGKISELKNKTIPKSD